MSEYRRFIAYIYAYRNGKKEKNAGFVKADVRGGFCRLQIRLQTGTQENQQLDCYGFVRRQGRILGILLGTGQLRQGRMELRLMAPEQSVGQDGKPVPFAELSGLWIQGENRLFLTVWDEEPVDVTKFTVQSAADEAGMEQPPDEADHEQNDSTENVSGGGAHEQQEEQESNTKTGLGGGAHEQQEERDDFSLAAQDAFAAISLRSDSDASAPAHPETPVANPACPDAGMAVRWPQFQYHYPREYPFEDEEIRECLRIALKDLDYLGEEGRAWCASPFVQQRYLKYRHLLLGRHENGKFILGVPGLNRNIQDVHLAAMYGFPEFKSGGDGAFGYWYRFLY